MDFLNKLGEKAGEVFQTVKESEATQKAKNYAEIPGLSIQVSKQETLIKQTYEAIGAAYFNAHQEDENDPYNELFQVVKEANAKIGQLKAEIEEKKKGSAAACDTDAKEVATKVCPACGKDVPKEALFCSICGNKFEEEKTAEESAADVFQEVTVENTEGKEVE